MDHSSTFLLVTVLVLGTIFAVVRSFATAKQSRYQLEKEEEQRLVIKSIGDGQRSIASALITIQSDLADIKGRLAAVEKALKDVE